MLKYEFYGGLALFERDRHILLEYGACALSERD